MDESRLEELSLKIENNSITEEEKAEFLTLYTVFLKKTKEEIQIEDIRKKLQEN